MLHNIINGYKKVFLVIARITALIALSVAFGFIIVFPFWKWATTFPHSYTVAILALSFIIAVYSIIKSFHGKKISQIIKSLIQIAIVILTLVSSIIFVINFHRLYALFSLVGGFLIYNFIAFGIKK